MKKVIVCALLLGVQLLVSCTKGVWLAEGVYRPKHPKFKILKYPFIKNNFIDSEHFYLSRKYYDGISYIGCYGFYNNGQMINTGGKESDINSILMTSNSFTTAPRVGYYTTEGDKIKFEYFVPGDGGQYETREGIIKKDTIILMETVILLFKKEVRNDTLVISSYPLK
jgi:hypothetical protein